MGASKHSCPDRYSFLIAVRCALGKVKDGWTDLSKRILKAIGEVPRDQMGAKAVLEAFESADNEKMNEIRARTNELVDDPQTADGLKAWYRQLCKRPTFHDESQTQPKMRSASHVCDGRWLFECA